MKINRGGVYRKQIVPMSKNFFETLSPREARPILEREFWQYIKMIVLAIFQTRHSDKILDSTLINQYKYWAPCEVMTSHIFY